MHVPTSIQQIASVVRSMRVWNENLILPAIAITGAGDYAFAVWGYFIADSGNMHVN